MMPRARQVTAARRGPRRARRRRQSDVALRGEFSGPLGGTANTRPDWQAAAGARALHGRWYSRWLPVPRTVPAGGHDQSGAVDGTMRQRWRSGKSGSAVGPPSPGRCGGCSSLVTTRRSRRPAQAHFVQPPLLPGGSSSAPWAEHDRSYHAGATLPRDGGTDHALSFGPVAHDPLVAEAVAGQAGGTRISSAAVTFRRRTNPFRRLHRRDCQPPSG